MWRNYLMNDINELAASNHKFLCIVWFYFLIFPMCVHISNPNDRISGLLPWRYGISNFPFCRQNNIISSFFHGLVSILKLPERQRQNTHLSRSFCHCCKWKWQRIAGTTTVAKKKREWNETSEDIRTIPRSEWVHTKCICQRKKGLPKCYQYIHLNLFDKHTHKLTSRVYMPAPMLAQSNCKIKTWWVFVRVWVVQTRICRSTHPSVSSFVPFSPWWAACS